MQRALLFALFFLAATLCVAQAPTGGIAGVVSDSSGAAIPNAKITISNADTGLVRNVMSGAAGDYSVASLPAGSYQVQAQAEGFQVVQRIVSVVTGSTTTTNFAMQVGAQKEVVQVEDAAPQINYDSHKIDGVVARQQIQDLPLNGRNFLQLAFLQPGVTVGTGQASQYNHQFTVSILGVESGQTRISVDGANTTDFVDGDSQQNFSQEIVQEFQVQTVNFDLSSGVAGAGAVNIVTRSGGNDFHGSGYFFFRDHNMSAYPALNRDATSPEPFFARRQSGFWFGGPIKKDRLFFFTNLEHVNQKAAISSQTASPDFAKLGVIAGSPYVGNQFSQRFDARLTQNHTLFLRYSHDGNHSFGPRTAPSMPSDWLKNKNWADQSVGSLTSTLRPTLVNEARFAYSYWNNRNLFPTAQDCPNCLGLDAPLIDVDGAGFTLGHTDNATQGRDLRRFIIADNVSWQKNTHRIRFGFESDEAIGTGFWGFNDPASIYLYSPSEVRSFNAILAAVGSPARIPLPSSFNTLQDILSLPLKSFVVGIGDASQPPFYNLDTAKKTHRWQAYMQDTWRATSRFTVNYGLAWSYESNLFNHDLTKPQFLAPILGAAGLRPTDKPYDHFAPAAGFAWNIGKDNKTVIRGGAGMYYGSFDVYKRLIERTFLAPLGVGRLPIPGSAVPNPFGTPGLPTIPLVPPGTPLDFSGSSPLIPGQPNITPFSGNALMAILNPVRAGLAAQLSNPHNTNLAVRNIDVFRSGSDLLTPDFTVPYSEHFNLGVQRELAHDLVISADFVFRQFIHLDLNNIDYNHYNKGRVIPTSLGPIEFRTSGGRSHYTGLLAKLDKRMTHHLTFQAAYALSKQMGNQGDVTNLNNWFDNWGPSGPRHVLNLSGIYELPRGFQVSFISQSTSRGPFNVNVAGQDFNGDGQQGDRLPGTTQNEFNRGLSASDLPQLISAVNSKYGLKLTLPSHYGLGDGFSSQDLRLSKVFKIRERFKFTVMAEVFNLFNIANLSGYNGNVADPGFGQPTSRVDQSFGSGGPRAFQFAGRFTF